MPGTAESRRSEFPTHAQAEVGQAIIGAAPFIVGCMLIGQRRRCRLGDMHADAKALVEVDAATKVLTVRSRARQGAVVHGCTERAFEINRRVKDRQLPGETEMGHRVAAPKIDRSTYFRTRRADP